MKAATKRKLLLEALNRATEVTPTRSVTTLVRSVLISARAQGVLALTTTDLTRSLVEHVDGEVPEPGDAVIPAKELQAVVAALSGDIVRLVKKDTRIEVSDEKKRKFKLPFIAASDFPNVPMAPADGEGRVSVGLPAQILGAALGRVSHAMSTDASRLALNAVNLEIHGPAAVRAAATDGHRVVLHGRTVAKVEAPHVLLIPGPSVKTIEQLCALAGHGIVTLVWRPDDMRTVYAMQGPRVAGFQIPQAEFPPFEQGMPPPGPARARVHTPMLIEAMQALLAADPGRENPVELKWADGKLGLSLEAVEQSARGEDSLACETEGAATVYVKPTYLIEALRAANEDVTLCSGENPMDPLTVLTETSVEFIMPIVLK